MKINITLSKINHINEDLICPQCKTKWPVGTIICPRCGKKL